MVEPYLPQSIIDNRHYDLCFALGYSMILTKKDLNE